MIVTATFLILLFIGNIKLNSKQYAAICIFTLVLLYVVFTPSGDMDLGRHNQIFEHVQSLNWTELFKFDASVLNSFEGILLNIYRESSPLYLIIVYVLSRFFSAKSLIIFTVLVVYGLSFYIVNDYAKRNSISSKVARMAIVFLLFSINFFDVSGIRNIMAASIGAFAVYTDVIQQRRRLLCSCLYLFAILIHPSAGIILAIRLLLLIKNKFWRRLCNVLVIMLVPALVILKISGFSAGGGFVGVLINLIIEKLYSFILGDSSSANLVTFNTLLVNIPARTISIMGTYIVYRKAKTLSKSLTDKNYDDFLMMFFCFLLSTILSYDMYVRMQFFAVLLVAPKLSCFFEKNFGNGFMHIKRNGAATNLIVLCGMFVVLAAYFILSYRWMDPYFF